MIFCIKEINRYSFFMGIVHKSRHALVWEDFNRNLSSEAVLFLLFHEEIYSVKGV